MKQISEITEIKNKRVLLRLDFNVPIEKGEIVDDFRIKESIPTIQFFLEKGAKVIVLAHIENSEIDTLKPIFEYLKEKKLNVLFAENIEDAKLKLGEIKEGSLILLENTRHYKGEKTNDESFTKQLADLGDIYVNDAFSVSHREHASIVGLPKLLPSFAGPLLMKEIENLSKVFNPQRPFLFVLGGAKFDTKLSLVEKFLELADHVFVGGALANDILKVRGMNVGKSLVSDFSSNSELKDKILRISRHPKLFLPVDVVAISSADNSIKRVCEPNELNDGEKIVDVGPETTKALSLLVQSSKMVLWNGPLGNYENGYNEGTLKLAEALGRTKAFTIIGGGDTLAAVKNADVLEKVGFASTGGGAMLDFLANGTLPGIDALK